MAKLGVTKHSGFMKDFVSFITKNIHPFDVSSVEIDLFLLKSAICKFLPVKFSKDSKLIAPNVFSNILILMPLENFSPHYQSGFQLNPGKINI